MSDPKSPKKSETLEVRISHPTKLAFMDKARAEGRVASDIVREQIELYLTEPTADVSPAAPAPAGVWTRAKRYLGLAALLPVLVGGALAVAAATAPAAASPELKLAFSALDTNGDGVVSRDEFTHPAKAHEIDIKGAQPALAQPLMIGREANAGAYVRYMLSVPDGDVPLLIAVDFPPAGKTDDAELAQLVDKAFGQLDRDGNGTLTQAEFLQS